MFLVALIATLHAASAADVQTYSVSLTVPADVTTDLVSIQGLGSWPDIISPVGECQADRDIGVFMGLVTFKKRVRHYAAKGETVGGIGFGTGFSGKVTGDCTFEVADGVALRVEFEITADPSLKFSDSFQHAQLVTAE